MFRSSESRHFNDEELAAIESEHPELKPEIAAARAVREVDVAAIGRVVKEVFSQYPYDQHHDHANPKCIRDVRYVVAYSCHAMIARDPRWLEDKLLIWLKTILQAFDFPDRMKSSAGVLFADKVMEEKLKTLPPKTKSIFHTYYRLRQEICKAVGPEHAALFSPYLEQAVLILPDKY
jgi:hypothetical protein